MPLHLRWSLAAIVVAVFFGPARAATAFQWADVSPEELQATASSLKPDAPAEVLLRRIEIDDQQFASSRVITEYVRVKIFRPEDAEDFARISHLSATSGNSSYELDARIIEPDGTIRTYGKEAVRNRKAMVEGARTRSFFADSTTQYFLAIPRVKPGSILEYRENTSLRIFTYGFMRFSLQQEDVPCRRFEFLHLQDNGSDRQSMRMESDVFLFNANGAPVVRDAKTGSVRITLTDIPAYVEEPMAGPILDSRTTLLVTTRRFDSKYRASGNSWVDPKLGAWAPLATQTWYQSHDYDSPTSKVIKLSKQLCAPARSDVEKARLIHAYVGAALRRYTNQPGGDYLSGAGTLNDMLRDDPHLYKPSIAFLYLELALFHAAGLKAEHVLLPDRTMMRFSREHVSPLFLKQNAIVVTIGDEQHFAYLEGRFAMPFDYLPWSLEGQTGLLARSKREDFIPIRLSPSSASIVNSLADLTLDESGNLEGALQVTLTGHEAAILRRMSDEPVTRIQIVLRARLKEMLGDEVDVGDPMANGMETPDAPLVIKTQLRWPGFAVVTRNRITLRPFVLACTRTSPLVAETRRSPVAFPYKWQEIDRVILRVPEGYALETRDAPPSSPGATLSQTVKLSFDPKAHALLSVRHFTSELIDVPPSAYAALKNACDDQTRAVRHEVVLIRQP